MTDRQFNQLYRHYDENGTLLYVGVSLSAINRLAQHRSSAIWYDQIAKIEIETYPDRKSVLRAEKDAIQKEHPLFNIQCAKPKLKIGSVVDMLVPTMSGYKGKAVIREIRGECFDNASLKIETHAGMAEVCIHEVKLCKDQSAPIFMSKHLPYGIWECKGKREVLFNRGYTPIWNRFNDGEALRCNPKEWVNDIINQSWFYDDTNSPWYNQKTYARCLNILKSWGIE